MFEVNVKIVMQEEEEEGDQPRVFLLDKRQNIK